MLKVNSFFSKYKWLIVFFDGDDEQVFISYAERLRSAGLLPQQFETWVADGGALREIGDKPCAELEMTEQFSEAVLNGVISKKKKVKANHLAVVLNRNLFCSEEAFVTAVKDTYFDNNDKYAICGRRNFLSFKKGLACYETPCNRCAQFSKGCVHSCFARLLWLVFGEDNRVIGILTRIIKDEKLP